MLFIYCIYAMEKETFERLFLYYKSILSGGYWNLTKQQLCPSMGVYMIRHEWFCSGNGTSFEETTTVKEDQLVNNTMVDLAEEESRERAFKHARHQVGEGSQKHRLKKKM